MASNQQENCIIFTMTYFCLITCKMQRELFFVLLLMLPIHSKFSLSCGCYNLSNNETTNTKYASFKYFAIGNAIPILFLHDIATFIM